MSKQIEIINDTDFTNEELEEMEWNEVETLTSKYSTLTITVYENNDSTLCKEIWNYGSRVDAIEYYELA